MEAGELVEPATAAAQWAEIEESDTAQGLMTVVAQKLEAWWFSSSPAVGAIRPTDWKQGTGESGAREPGAEVDRNQPSLVAVCGAG